MEGASTLSTYLNLKPIEFDKLSAKRKAAVQWNGRFLLPKYDGCLALVYIARGNVVTVRSRDDKIVKSLDHIEEDLFVRYPHLALVDSACVIGEAWRPGTEFSVISGEFRRQRPQPQLGLAVFDLVDVDPVTEKLYSNRPYCERLARLQDYRAGLNNVFPPNPVLCEDEDHAWRYANNLKKMGGYDGAIASDPYATYEVSDGRGEFLKLKPLRSFTLECVGVERGIGDKTGRATCALVVRFKQTVCKVGTGLSEAEQANPEQFIGKLIEVTCMDVYAGPDGLMREPRFVGVRTDVTTPDY